MLSVEELQVLVATICNPSTDRSIRSAAERRLQELQSEPGSWRAHLQLLLVVEDTLLFFVCLGLQRIIWKQWNSLDVSDQESIVTTVVTVLANKSFSLPLFARSKAELVLSAICQNSYSFDPILKLIESQNPQIVFAGLSALRTILEEVFQSDPRVSQASRDVLIKSAYSIVGPATALACAVCQSYLDSSVKNGPSMTVALSLLKVICGKIELGPHISPSMLGMLFSIAELGAVADGDSSSGSYADCSVKAVGVLSELMSRRYIPRAPPTQQLTVGPNGGVAAISTPGKDIGADILVDLVVKAINLLQKYRAVGDVDESPVVLPLLEFITSFAECHLERCLMSPSSGMAANISLFLREIASLSCASTEPKYLAKVASVWDNLLDLEAIQDHMVIAEGESVCCIICSHFLGSSLVLLNPNLKEMSDELEDDLLIDPFADPHIRELVGHLGSSGFNSPKDQILSNEVGFSPSSGGGTESTAGQPENAEELTSEGSVLRLLTISILSRLCTCTEVHNYLSVNLPQLMQNALAVLASPDGLGSRGAAIDIVFLVKLLPLVLPSDGLSTNLSMLLSQFIETRLYSKGKPYVAIIVVISQVITQLIPRVRGSSSKPTEESSAGLVSLSTSLLPAIVSACDTMIAPAPFLVVSSLSTLLLQYIASFERAFDAGILAGFRESIINMLQTNLLPRAGQLPIEVQALLICSASIVIPDIARSLADQLHSISQTICRGQSSAVSTTAKFATSAELNTLNRLCGSLDALARHHNVASMQKRQYFVTSVVSLQHCLIPLLNYCLETITNCAIGSSGQTGLTSTIATTHIILSLINGLVSSLGKKSFGQMSLLALDSCAAFLQTESREILCSSYSGLGLLKQMLQLVIDVATASSSNSSTTPHQINITTTILSFVVSRMSNPQVCAELLQQTLKAGTVSVSCYWQHKQLRPGVAAPVEDSGVLPIALLLVQLFVGSMDPGVPPHEAQEAIDGISLLTSDHNLFSVVWFQDGGCWSAIASAVLKSLLLQSHPTLQDSLGSIFDMLIKSDVSSSSAPALAQGLWSFIANDVFRVGSEIGCKEAAGRYLNALLAKYSDIRKVDANLFVAEVVVPLSVEIAKAKDM